MNVLRLLVLTMLVPIILWKNIIQLLIAIKPQFGIRAISSKEDCIDNAEIFKDLTADGRGCREPAVTNVVKFGRDVIFVCYEDDYGQTFLNGLNMKKINLNIQFYLKVRSGNNVHKLGLRSSSLPRVIRVHPRFFIPNWGQLVRPLGEALGSALGVQDFGDGNR